MLDILKFIFSSFWIFCGTMIIIALIGSMIIGLVGAIRGCDIKMSVFGDVETHVKDDD